MTLQERLTALVTAIGADMKGKAPSEHAHANATPSAVKRSCNVIAYALAAV